MVPFSFASHDFHASPDRALHWPAENALLVADLHLEKASWFARLGQFLPPYDSHATLAALERDIDRSGAKTLYCLGDSFHDRFGCDRLPAAARDLLLSLTARIDWVWIVGNHDAGFVDHCGGRLVEEITVAGIVLRHEAERDDPTPEMSGHYHPKLRLTMKGRHVSRRCYVATATKVILPAYGALTGGLDAHHPEIVKKVGPGASALVPVTDRLLRFPIAA
jgi:DNA ligase-associated metallophosphoesterase